MLILAAYVYSSIISQNENERIEQVYSTDKQHWGSFDEVKKAKKEGELSDEEYAAFWALEASMGVSKERLPQTAISFLEHHIKDSEYYGIDHLKGSKEAIRLLEKDKVFAEYVAMTISPDQKIGEKLSKRIVPDRNPLVPADDYDAFSEALAKGLGVEDKQDKETKQIVKANIYKQPTGSYVIQASINGQDLEQKPIDNKIAVGYLRLNEGTEKESMLSSIVKEKYGEELRLPKNDNQVSNGLKI